MSERQSDQLNAPQTKKNDIDMLNRNFEQYKIKRKNEMEKQMAKYVRELSKQPRNIPPYDLPIGQIAINTKDVVLDAFDDILGFMSPLNPHRIQKSKVLAHNDKMFYIGLAITTIAVLAYTMTAFTSTPTPPAQEIKVIIQD